MTPNLKLLLPDSVQAQIAIFEDLPGYLNRPQFATACGVEPATTLTWENLPPHKLKIGNKFYWLPDEVEDFILEYRTRNGKELKNTQS